MMDANLPPQMPLALTLRFDTTFATFKAGKNKAIVDCLANKLEAYPERLIYLWGERGVGKTHLLQACCHWASEQGQTSFYLPLDKHSQFTPNIMQGLENIALVCIDNIASIAGQLVWEEQLFHFYNRMVQTKNHLLIADPLPAAAIAFFLPDLHSRLKAMVPFQLQALSDEDKIEALQTRARLKGLELSHEVLNFLIQRSQRSLPDLFALLETLDEASLSAKRKITIPFVKEVLNI